MNKFIVLINTLILINTVLNNFPAIKVDLLNNQFYRGIPFNL